MFKVFALCLVRNIWQYGVGCAAESLISDTSRRALTSAVTRTHNRGDEQASCSPRNVFSATLPSLTARYRLLAGVGGNQGARWASNVTRWRISLPHLPHLPLSSSTSSASSFSSRGRTFLHPTIHSFQDISQKPQLISIQSRFQYRRYPMMMGSFHLIRSQKIVLPTYCLQLPCMLS